VAVENVVMVGGGKGGVGKSSVTAGLARQFARRGSRVGVIDADLAGPSQSLLFSCGPMNGAEGRLTPAMSAESIAVASIGLIVQDDTALVWSDATAAGTAQLLTDPGMWEDRDVLLVDLPPGQGRVTIELAQRFPDAVCVLVTTGSVLALEECARAAAFLRRMDIRVAALVENMAFHSCPTCGTANALFDDDRVRRAAERLGVPLLAQLPFGGQIAQGYGLEELALKVLSRQVIAKG
jgi:ATP-binding protein involved in chromosome partitioning